MSCRYKSFCDTNRCLFLKETKDVHFIFTIQQKMIGVFLASLALRTEKALFQNKGKGISKKDEERATRPH